MLHLLGRTETPAFPRLGSSVSHPRVADNAQIGVTRVHSPNSHKPERTRDVSVTRYSAGRGMG
jgi:hypothetical protein